MLSSCSVGYYAGSNVGVITTANLSLQPAWGPAGYDCAHYYYFPDFNFYYDVNNALFYYLSGSRWVSARQLPYALGYPRDLYKLYKVVLNIRDPWNHNRVHRREYKHFCGVHTQPVLRDKHPQSRPPQMQRPQNKPQQPQRPQNNGYAPNDNRNTIRNSRNNNTSHNNVAPQSTPSRNNNNTSAQKPQNTKPKQNPQTTSGSRSNKEAASGSRSNVKPSQPKQSQNSGTSRSSSNKSNSSGGSRSTGSRGR